MPRRTNFDNLRREVQARPGAEQRLAATRAETLEEMRLYELRHAEAISQSSWPGGSPSPREPSL